MKAVVPLAGPDFDRADGTVKAQISVDGGPLLRIALGSRIWSKHLNASDYVFVLRDTATSRAFSDGNLNNWFPGSGRVWLSNYTAGAAMSALAGLSLLDVSDEPLVVDLADILFEASFDPISAFASDPTLGAILPTFTSENPLYSYATVDEAGWVLKTAEKSVISDHASAGAYLFRDQAVYLNAVTHSLRNAAEMTYRGLFFVCPLMNGVIATGFRVRAEAVDDIRDLKF